MSNIAIKWTGENSQMFIGRDTFGHVVMSGSWPQDDPQWQEWKALKPSDLLLISLASCTGYDLVMILKRQRQQLNDLYIRVDSQQADNPPYQFTDIHIHYTISGDNLDTKKVARAIELSEERYCSVAATIRGVANITHSYEIKPAKEDLNLTANPSLHNPDLNNQVSQHFIKQSRFCNYA